MLSFLQGDRHLLACGRLEREQICLNTVPPDPLPGEVPTEVRGVRRRTHRQCFLDRSGALRVAMGSDPVNPEWFPRWDLGALLICSALFPLGELGKRIIHFPSSSIRLYLEGPTLSALGRKGCWEEDKDSHFLPGPAVFSEGHVGP